MGHWLFIAILQKKLVENPNFYHAYQMDDGNQITNVFWANASMLIDNEFFL
jgi:hypothetical protein